MDILKAVHQVKWKLVRVRQEHSKSYKEVCTSVLERCRFLLNDIRPFHCQKDQKTNVNVLKTSPKLKMVAKKIMQQNRTQSNSPGIPTLLRPEDILNVSIQSQEAILSSSNNDPEDCEQRHLPTTLELDKDALIDRIQQQQLRERIGSLPNSCTPVLDEDLDDEDVDDEAKDEDSKRHDHKPGK